MGWVDLMLASLCAAAIVYVPGLAVSRVLGVRGLWTVALAAPAGVTIMTIAAIGAPFVGLRWGALPVVLATAVFVAVAVVVRLAVRRAGGPESDPRLPWGGVVAIVAAVAAGLLQVLRVIGAPENISQTFDNIFHLNAIRFVLDTGNASPLFLGNMTSAHSGGVPFYPSAWHALGALVAELTGVTVPVASNALTILFPAVVWPIGIVTLTAALWGRRTAVLVGASVAAVSLPAFPLFMVEYGALFPYLMGLSLVPVAVAVLVRLVTGPERGAAKTVWVVAFVGTVPGIGVGHPGALMALLVATTAVIAVAAVGRVMAVPETAHRPQFWLGLAAYVVVAGAMWFALRPPAEARTWLQTETAGQAVGEVLTVSVAKAGINASMALLVVIGVVAAWRRRDVPGYTALVLLVFAGTLYVVVSGLPYWELRDMLTGAWYNNAPRLAAILPLAWGPLAALGFATTWEWFAARSRRAPEGRQRLVVSVLAIAVMTVLVVLPQATSMRQAVADGRKAFRLDADSRVVSIDEWKLLQRLDEHVPEGAVIAGSPWTGTSLAYALSARRVLMPHILTDIDEDTATINDGLVRADRRPEVCDALQRAGVEYVLDFGRREVQGERHRFPGLDGLAYSDSVTLVDSEGDAALYRIVACGLTGEAP